METPCQDHDETSKWCNLPKDLLFLIISLIDCKIHLTRIRSVCPKWRSALPLDELHPMLNPHITVPNLYHNLPTTLPQTRFYFFSPLSSYEPDPTESVSSRTNLCGRWVTRMFELRPNTWHLCSPLNLHDYFLTSPPITGSINLLDCRVFELCQTFTLITGEEEQYTTISKKVVGGWNFDSSYKFALLVQLDSDFGGGLVSWKLGDEEWTTIEGTNYNNDNNVFHIFDIAYHDGKFYAFDLSGWRLGIIDPANPTSAMEFMAAPDVRNEAIDDVYIVKFNGSLYDLWGLYLVPCNGHLYLVFEFGDHFGTYNMKAKTSIIVFMLKQETRWEQVQNLGDQILFIGYDVSFSLPLASINLPQWKPSSICMFTRPEVVKLEGYYKGPCWRCPKGVECLDFIHYPKYWKYFKVFDMEEEEQSVVPFEKLSKQIYTGLFFPPPAWVQWRCPTIDNVEVIFDFVTFPDIDVDDENC